MTLGIICVVIIASIAIHQTHRVLVYQGALLKHRKELLEYRQALEVQRSCMIAANGKLATIAAALPLLHAAATRGDARACHAILAAAIERANAIRAELPATEQPRITASTEEA